MELQKIKDASKILDYWFTIEFLGQDSYEMSTKAIESQNKSKIHKKNLLVKKDNKQKQLTTFLELTRGQSFYDVIKRECEDCRMSTWGNITVYLGKIKRELCIENIAQYLKSEDSDRPEKNYDDIAVASFQVDANGKYIEHSFSLSTIIWAISKLQKNSKGQLANVNSFLSDKSYKEDLEGLEKDFWGTRSNNEEKNAETPLSKDMDSMPVFCEDSITIEKLVKISSRIRQQYIDKFAIKATDEEESTKEVYGISFQLFKDEAIKEKYDDDNYLGLSHDYFSNDLRMVKDMLEKGEFNNSDGMYNKLLKYINAPWEENNISERYDVINVKDYAKAELWLQEVLNIRNAPLGKWPSRHMPALMQQVAVNYGIAKGNSDAFSKPEQIFSVNGPPGTGKTTLLKEIVASSIIEKAKKLGEYSEPDDAFKKNKFLHGDKINGSYSKFIQNWYSLKDDSINDYSLLLTSCNNRAVENVTKELPMESGILNNLKENETDSDLMKEQLETVRNLFSIDKCSKYEKLYNRKGDKEGEYKEIYFTGYAQTLFEASEAWGLVAAPLGKKSNIKSFYYNVLEPLHWDFYPNGQFKEIRMAKYVKAREKFQQQLKKVEGLQKGLAKLGDIALQAKKEEKKCEISNAHFRKLISTNKQKLVKLQEQETMLQTAIESLRKEVEIQAQAEYMIFENLEHCKKICMENKNSLVEAQQKVLTTTNSNGILTKLFNKRKSQDIENLAESYRRQASEFHSKLAESERQLFELEEKVKRIKGEYELKKSELIKIESEQQILSNSESELLSQINESEQKIVESIEKLKSTKKWCKHAMEAAELQDETNRGLILDDQFIADLFSSDEKASTRAQISNLWVTDYYNRERERLVYYALQLTREFILNSKCCRDNFVTLGQYWGLRMNEDKVRVSFHENDRKRMAGALYQTLFLLVPVISSTFASIGALLRDIKTPNVIGNLIVDEAGQAQPQMAVGALYRSRRAMIVGDPKQIEPVVTNDLELLKKSFDEEIYKYYQDKSLSVQRCADILNPYGTYLSNGIDGEEWVGCPLVVHRRCIAPMYEVSNKISYGGIMKQQTLLPDEETQKNFVYEKSQWINIIGVENGRKDHFVKEQGDKVCEILELAFKNHDFPNCYIISPFKSVVYGVRKHIKDYYNQNVNSFINKSRRKGEWLNNNVGTVHTFQGKEANEVIFLLGCDGSKAAEGAIQWVNSNIVNVAVTRAKYRLYVLGDARAWCSNPVINEMKLIIDTFALKEIELLTQSDIENDEKEAGYRKAAKQIPSAGSFPVEEVVNKEGEVEFSVETDGFISNLNKINFMEKALNKEQLQGFGFQTVDELDKLPSDIRRNIMFGMKLYYLLEPVYRTCHNLDASCCAILFCKALELQLKTNFVEGLKNQFPEHEIKVHQRKIKLGEVKEKDFMIGTIQFILKNHESKLSEFMQSSCANRFDLSWWHAFNEKLKLCANKRNKCCHSQWFNWKDMSELIHYEFGQDGENSRRNPKLGGVFFESIVGKKL